MRRGEIRWYRSKIGGLVTTLGPARMPEVRAALLFALGYVR